MSDKAQKSEEGAILPDKNGCYQQSSSLECCCTCKWHLPVHYHCTTARSLRDHIERLTGKDTCICSIQKGWACIDSLCNRVYTDWPEHSIGCELHEPKSEVATKNNG